MKHTTEELMFALQIRELAIRMRQFTETNGGGSLARDAPFPLWVKAALLEATTTADIIKSQLD